MYDDQDDSDDATVPPPADAVELEPASDFFEFPTQPTTSLTQEYFSALGPMCTRLGWAVIPQQRGERRLPGKVDGEVIRFSKYFETGPTIEEVLYWSTLHFNTNVAALLGPSSGNIFAIDIDVSDVDLVHLIEDVAYDTLGFTPFKRIGSRPKRALLYRTELAEDIPGSRQMALEGDEGHLVEILGARKLLTIYGRHHRTLRPFRWIGEQPALDRPELVPSVTPAQIAAFVRTLHAIRPIVGGPEGKTASRIGGFILPPTATTTVRAPKLRTLEDFVRVDGLVVDGREQLLFQIARAVVGANPGAALTDEGRSELLSVTKSVFEAHALCDGKWTGGALDRAVAEKVAAQVRRVEAGEVGERSYAPKLSPQRPAVLAFDRTHGDNPERSTAWVWSMRRGKVLEPAPIGKRARATDFVFEGEPQAEIPGDLRIPTSVEEQKARVTAEIEAALRLRIGAHFRRHRDGVEGAEDLTPTAHLLRGVAGSGKTTTAMRLIAEMADDERPAPILFVVPGYKLAHQVYADAIAMGIAADRIILWTGQAKSAEFPDGCRFAELVALLQAAGRSSTRLCRASRMNGLGEMEETFCPFFATCKRTKDLAAIASAHVVIAVHAYATLNLPSEFDACRTVIIDENVEGTLQKTKTMKLGTLDLARSLAFLSKKEKARGLQPGDHFENRALIADVVKRELRAGRDPARWFAVDGIVDGREMPATKRQEMLRDTISMLSRDGDHDAVYPGMPEAALRELCSQATAVEIREEWKLWRLIEDRVPLVAEDLVAEGLAAQAGTNVPRPKRKAAGKTDRRVHYYRGKGGQDQGTVRLSWLSENRFADRDLLFLDASANLTLTERSLGRPVVQIDVTATDRIRTVYVTGYTFSKSQILPSPRDDAKARAFKAELRIKLRHALVGLCAMHVGGVVACAPKAVVEYLREGWTRPRNLELLYFGNTKGLNAFKGYDAAVSIGCLNPSARQIDDAVAAYVADDDDAEPMIDPVGENRDEGESEPEFVYRDVDLRLRNGATMRVNQRTCDGRYAGIIYDAVRKEEHIQFRARLRGILRDDVPSFYNMGSYIPEHIVVDDVITFDQLASFGAGFEASRRHGIAIGEVVHGMQIDDHAAAQRLLEIVEEPAIARNLVRVRDGEKEGLVPVFAADRMKRLAEDGMLEIVSHPDTTPIIKPDTYDEDRDLHIARDLEEDGWTLVARTAEVQGWWYDRERNRVYHQDEPDVFVSCAAVTALLAPTAAAWVEDAEAFERECEEERERQAIHDWYERTYCSERMAA